MAKNRSLNVVLPVYNEESELEDSVSRLKAYLKTLPKKYLWKITIVDNASDDDTMNIALGIAKKDKRIIALHLDQKGRGRAVKHAWTTSSDEILAYMDIDLSTDLTHFEALLHSLEHGYDIAIGSRNLSNSRVSKRHWLRTITSKGYIFLIKMFFFVHFSDAQCGFKVVSRKVVTSLLPLVSDNEWFFDTELLILAEKLGYKIYEEPVTWVDNPGSTVRVMKTATGDLEGLWRLFIHRPWRTYERA
ncbi:glycosyltransferase family 2 protein [Candidatus Gottesmanbacteria bacterium]|nr:glycosyltransferase family 2 protein [Candidatus Gottesmanbacteria bacterium]